MNYVDFHCHLDLYPDMGGAIADAERSRVYTLTVTTTPKAWPRNRDLTRACQYVRPALGIHPQLVGAGSVDFELWKRYLPEARYVGEIGLDAGPRFYRFIEQQQQVFNRVLTTCAEVGGKILTVHSVRAVKRVLDSIEANLPADQGRVVLHWFSGSVAEARRAVTLGCFFSINTAMMSTDRGRALVVSLPLDRLLTETDGPFTAVGGRPARPSDIGLAVSAIAAARGCPAPDIVAAVHQNLKKLTQPDS